MLKDRLLKLKASLPTSLKHQELLDDFQYLEVLVDGPADECLLVPSAEGK
jgi:hypothetical protein